jgi:phosphatidylserine decarboxylase
VLYYGKVESGILEQVKGVTYSLRGFLGPQTWFGAQSSDINHISDEDYQVGGIFFAFI